MTNSQDELLLTYGQVNRLQAGDGVDGDKFGHTLATDNDILAIGAYMAEVNGHESQGAVYIYERSSITPHTWIFLKKITASDGRARDHFGLSVAVEGDLIIVGAHQADLVQGNPTQTDHGAAYIFGRNQGGPNNWGQLKKITANDVEVGAQFGWSVDLDGQTALVGAFKANIGANNDQGAVYFFEQNNGGGNNWGQIQKFSPGDGEAGDYFGFAVALEGITAVVGAQQVDVVPFQDQGAAYVLERSGTPQTPWTQSKKLLAGDGLQRDLFGHSVSISGDLIAVGAYWADHMFNADQGAAYLFSRNQGGGNQWGEIKKLQSDDGLAGDHFGQSVSLTGGDQLVVGAPGAISPGGSGSVYVYTKNSGGTNNWGLAEKLLPAGIPEAASFGTAVEFDSQIILIGADGSGPVTDPGQVLIFSNSPPTLTNRLFLPLSSRP